MKGCLAAFVVGSCWVVAPACADGVDPKLRQFFNSYCIACHGPETQEADFRVDQLKISATATDAEYWQLVLDNLNLDYVRTARSKGLRERAVIIGHVLRNSLIPVVTLIALGVPAIFAGAIITEQIFRFNGLGALLIIAIQGADIPLVQSLTFIFAVLIVMFNILVDILYGILDPRIRYD